MLPNLDENGFYAPAKPKFDMEDGFDTLLPDDATCSAVFEI